MLRRPALLTALAAALLVTAPAGPALAAKASPRSGYSGTASVTVTTFEYCGPNFSRVPSGRATYSVPARLLIGKRRAVGRVAEPNPFSFSLAAGNQAAAGGVSLWSSAISTVSSHDVAGNYRDPRLLLSYWRSSYRGSTLTGTLINTHSAEALALNLYTEPRPTIPCRTGYGMLQIPTPVRVGSTIRGTLTSARADVTVAGGTTTGLVEFVLRFRA